MKHKILFINFFIAVLFFSCTKKDDVLDNALPNNNNTPKVFDIVGEYAMNSGPHALATKENYVFAGRDDKIYVIDISTPASPKEVAVFDDFEKSNTFEALLIVGNTLYAGCTASAGVYAIDISTPASPSLLNRFCDTIYAGVKVKPLKLFYLNNTLWAAGSSGSGAMLVKYSVRSASSLVVDNYWVSNQTGNAAGGVWANATNVFISTANGYIYAFNNSAISTGPIGSYTFEEESGHSHWGKTIIGDGNKLFWADWGAGFVTLNISNPQTITALNFITHSAFKSQFPDAEGTDVYDFVMDNATGKMYVANGWSGLLQVSLSSPGKVDSYVDYHEHQYFCIAQAGKNVVVGNISGGISGTKGLKIIKIAD